MRKFVLVEMTKDGYIINKGTKKGIPEKKAKEYNEYWEDNIKVKDLKEVNKCIEELFELW